MTRLLRRLILRVGNSFVNLILESAMINHRVLLMTKGTAGDMDNERAGKVRCHLDNLVSLES